jgi:hypothetical protein
MRKILLIVLGAIAAACVSPDGPFTAVGRTAMPLYEARKHCKAEHSSTESDGSAQTDWASYERCMADLGWIKQTSPNSTGSAASGGGSPY